jgi:hypothetical protein
MILKEKVVNYKVVVLIEIYNFGIRRFPSKVVWKF